MLVIIPLTEAITGGADPLEPPSLRSLDAKLGGDLGALVTYDGGRPTRRAASG